MDDKTLAIFSGIHTYKLNEHSHSFGPLRDFYYNHRSLTKYWMLTRDLIAQTLHANKEFFEIPENDDGDDLDQDKRYILVSIEDMKKYYEI